MRDCDTWNRTPSPKTSTALLLSPIYLDAWMDCSSQTVLLSLSPLFTALYRHTNQSNMWTIREFAVSFVALALMGVAEGQEWNIVEAVTSDIPSTNAVELTCIFNNDWSEATHPIDYPGTDAHWSPMVLAAHSDQYEMWASGTLASNGIVSVAEVCRNHILLSRSQQNND